MNQADLLDLSRGCYGRHCRPFSSFVSRHIGGAFFLSLSLSSFSFSILFYPHTHIYILPVVIRLQQNLFADDFLSAQRLHKYERENE